MSALVVATEEEKGVWIPNLEGPKVEQTLEAVSSGMSRRRREEGTHFDTEVASIDVVSEEEVGRVDRVVTNLKYSYEVILR